MTLHILSSRESLRRCAPALQTEDAVLLTRDAVYLALQPDTLPATTYALENDLQARGLEGNSGQIPVVDMAGFVELTILHPHCLSW